MEKKYLVYIESYVNITITSTNFLLYNTLNGKFFEGNERSILDIIKSKYMELDDIQLKQKCIKEFISKIRECFIGDLIDIDNFSTFPVKFEPKINVRKSTDYLNENKLEYDDSFDNYLNEITIYLNSYSGKLGKFSMAYKQFFFPLSNEEGYIEIEYDKLINFIDQAYSFGLLKVNIIVGDLISYKRFDDLMLYFKKREIKCYLFCYYNQIEKYGLQENIKRYIEGFNTKINLLLTLPLDFIGLGEFVSEMPVSEISLDFVLCDITEFKTIENNSVDFQNSIKLKPLYTGDNVDFFQDSIYLEKEDILENKIELNELLKRTVLNPNDFGKLVLFPDGAIFGNVNNKQIGKLDQFNISKIIRKAISSDDYGWMLTRKMIEPCNECHYNIHCPPISNYEYAIGKYNLCHVWKN